MVKSNKSNRTAAPINKASDTDTSAPAPAAGDAAANTAAPAPQTTPEISDRNVADHATDADQNEDQGSDTNRTAQTSVPGNNAAASDEANAAAANDTSLDGTPVGVAQGDDTEVVEVKASMKRAELNDIAAEAGLTNVSSYKDRATVVTAIERVLAGEGAEAVDAELAPVEDDDEAAASVEVEVTASFYDMKTNASRSVGDKYKTTEERASELRGRKLVK